MEININVNFSGSLQLPVELPGVLPFLSQSRNMIMTKFEELQASADANLAAAKALQITSKAANDKVDALALAHGMVKDELAALKATIASGVGITEAQIDVVLVKQAEALAAINATSAEDSEQAGQTDAAV